MTTSIVRADLGRTATIDADALLAGTRLIAVSRLARAQLAAPAFSIWCQLRGTASVDTREGRFRLGPGDWIALDSESLPGLQAARDGLVLGMVAAPRALPAPGRILDHALFPGRGHCPKRDRIITLRVWREAARQLQSPAHRSVPAHAACLDPVLMHLSSLQRDIHRDFDRCPGKSSSRKAKVFRRLQRARLFLEGNGDRIVGLDELARQASFSRWYLSKTFQATYGESLQAASRRIRIARACRLLAETSLSICDVAAHCGFDNPCSFARAFRFETGMTPTRYRDAHGRGLGPQRQADAPTAARASRAAALSVALR